MSFDDFLKAYSLYIALALALLIAVIIALFYIIPAINKKRTTKVKTIDYSSFYEVCGGKDNIKSLSLTGTRLTLVCIDQSLVDKEKLKKEGVVNIITMSKKMVLLIEDRLKEVVSDFNIKNE
ncbi:MAG TPA: PTS transporter subunit EIIB [Bacilli bacterium]|nr:PTS transporter subunit EIIB [Bacilli bacterium]